MKIVKYRALVPKQKKKSCQTCKTRFIYDSTDIKSDWREGDYVICPSCKTFIAV